VRFPAESHELTRSGSPVHRVMGFEILLDWFDRLSEDGLIGLFRGGGCLNDSRPLSVPSPRARAAPALRAH